ncbi:MAG TPA: 16S rRNA (adenine(1518)-N(6)/adenine(1519)-N(6))-dimethyltransferase RsmA [Syntrophomonadaceae bacterium]|nr:16S rRNA (adenine(1518)-N(6)/adenine(1519)-N(6))-dimethyltransferase RsmA [Syntrophomonadaceae bacterium]
MIKISSISNLKDVLNRYELYPKKRWGQNFLIDHNIIDKIILTADINEDDYVIEIGPGLGALTQELAKNAKGVLAIDIDENLKLPLQEVLDGNNNCKLLFADILKVDLEAELRKAFGLNETPAYKVCANIPYNITTPIIFNLLENSSNLNSATLMMQKEVATRILAEPNNKDYGRLTLMVALYAQTKLGFNVSRNCFYPKPQVDSYVLSLIPNEVPAVIIDDVEELKAFIKNAFQKRRKTILNICSSFFDVDKNVCKPLLVDLDINPLHRPENLTLVEFAVIHNTFLIRG